MCRRTAAILLLATGLLALPAGARADIIVFKTGRALQGRPVRVGEMLRIELAPGASVVVRQDEVREIRPGTWKDEYLRRRAALGAADARGRYRLAAWCRNKNLIAQYEAELKAILKLEPGHDGALSRLERLREARAAAAGRARERTRLGVPAGLRHFSTEHIVATSDGAAGSAEKAARAGEEVIKDFAKLLGIAGSDRRLKHFRVRLRHYRTAAEYKKAADKAGVSGNSGFYSAAQAACHVLGKPDGTLGPGRSRTVRHELTHALVWRILGISSRDPWLHEALATLLEGEGEKNIAGKRLWYLAASAGRVDLSVAGLYRSSFTTGTLHERLRCYARVWSFAHFMLHSGDDKRRKTFMSFLADCRGWKTDLRRAFERHFPDGRQLEEDWRTHANVLITRHLPARYQKLVPQPTPDYDSPRRRTVSPRRQTDAAGPEKREAKPVRPEEAATPIPSRRRALWLPARRSAR